jgi:ferrous iron transport protein B
MAVPDRKIVVALAGNPNSGKTTIFNNLTGANQHVGNFPGVTVEKKEGHLTYDGYNIKVVISLSRIAPISWWISWMLPISNATSI